jgi:hypothetical protein
LGGYKKEPIDIQIKKRKWRLIWHTVKNAAFAIEKDVLYWNLQGAGRRTRPRITWGRKIEEKITEMGKTWRVVKALANQRQRWRSFTGSLYSIRK